MRFGLALAALALCSSCTLSAPRENVVGLRAELISGQGTAGIDGPNPSTEVMGVGATYEFLPFSDNGNIKLAYQYRNYEFRLTPGDPTIKTHVLMAGPNWTWELFEDDPEWVWYFNPHLGVTVHTDSDDFPGTDYWPGFYLDAELGVRWSAEPNWGLEAFGNWSVNWLRRDNNTTPNINLSGYQLGIGVWYDF